MTTTPRVLSWNVRGLNDLVKKLAVFRTIKRRKTSVICFQETKLSPTPQPCFSFGGSLAINIMLFIPITPVSIFICQGITFSCDHALIDSELTTFYC